MIRWSVITELRRFVLGLQLKRFTLQLCSVWYYRVAYINVKRMELWRAETGQILSTHVGSEMRMLSSSKVCALLRPEVESSSLAKYECRTRLRHIHVWVDIARCRSARNVRVSTVEYSQSGSEPSEMLPIRDRSLPCGHHAIGSTQISTHMSPPHRSSDSLSFKYKRRLL